MRWPWSKPKKPVQPRVQLIAPSRAYVGETVTLDGTLSLGDIANYRFELEYGVTSWGPGRIFAQYRYEKPGTYLISLVLIGPTAMVTEYTHTLIIESKA